MTQLDPATRSMRAGALASLSAAAYGAYRDGDLIGLAVLLAATRWPKADPLPGWKSGMRFGPETALTVLCSMAAIHPDIPVLACAYRLATMADIAPQDDFQRDLIMTAMDLGFHQALDERKQGQSVFRSLVDANAHRSARRAARTKALTAFAKVARTADPKVTSKALCSAFMAQHPEHAEGHGLAEGMEGLKLILRQKEKIGEVQRRRPSGKNAMADGCRTSEG